MVDTRDDDSNVEGLVVSCSGFEFVGGYVLGSVGYYVG